MKASTSPYWTWDWVPSFTLHLSKQRDAGCLNESNALSPITWQTVNRKIVIGPSLPRDEEHFFCMLCRKIIHAINLNTNTTASVERERKESAESHFTAAGNVQIFKETQGLQQGNWQIGILSLWGVGSRIWELFTENLTIDLSMSPIERGTSRLLLFLVEPTDWLVWAALLLWWIFGSPDVVSNLKTTWFLPFPAVTVKRQAENPLTVSCLSATVGSKSLDSAY